MHLISEYIDTTSSQTYMKLLVNWSVWRPDGPPKTCPLNYSEFPKKMTFISPGFTGRYCFCCPLDLDTLWYDFESFSLLTIVEDVNFFKVLKRPFPQWGLDHKRKISMEWRSCDVGKLDFENNYELFTRSTVKIFLRRCRIFFRYFTYFLLVPWMPIQKPQLLI